jgi:hypothetical protein
MQDIPSYEAVSGGYLPVSAKNPTNLAASIRQKLLNHAKTTRQDFQRVIDGYAIEGILDRLANSAYADRFLLKGALLFAVWKGLGQRPTRDIDLMGRGANKEIVSIDIKDDSIHFSRDAIEGLRIKEDDEYEGVRVNVSGEIGGAKFKVQIDIGFGDAVTPPPVYAAFPRILPMRTFSLLMYPPETVFSEKLEAIVSRGMLNRRMKDFYALSILVKDKMVQPTLVRRAVQNTFERRKTNLPATCPVGLSVEFSQDATKIIQWKSFLKKSGLESGQLSDAIALIRDFTKRALSLDW